QVAGAQIFTEGATDAFLLGAGLMVVASLVTWVFLNVKHQELATDGPEAPVHVG
ncbi:MAG: MFS transporter, partial [Nocardioides sp.]|nr:MFS transporter [Nocardioides sp.]